MAVVQIRVSHAIHAVMMGCWNLRKFKTRLFKVPFWSPNVGGHLNSLNLWKGHVNSPSQKGHRLAELPGTSHFIHDFDTGHIFLIDYFFRLSMDDCHRHTIRAPLFQATFGVYKHPFDLNFWVPPLQFNIAPEKLPKPNRKVAFQPPFFRGHVSFGGSKWSAIIHCQLI